MLTTFLENDCIQYDANKSTQLRMYGNGLVQGTNTTNCEGIPSNLKRIREGDDAYAYQQHLRPMSLDNNFRWNKAGFGGPLLNPTYPISACLKRSCKEDGGGSTLTCSTQTNMVKNAICGLQTDEFSQILKLQEENIVKGVRELHHKHTVSLLNAFENGVKRKLHEKELEIENMKRKNKELEDKINQVSLEAQSWQWKAKDNESVVNALKYNIQQLMLAQANEGSGDTSEIDDAVSRTHRDGADIKQEVEKHYMKYCRVCKGKEPSVMLLPCQHLCLCADCGVDICPLCKVMKTEAVPVYMQCQEYHVVSRIPGSDFMRKGVLSAPTDKSGP